jgi:hypothetical protein
LRTDGDVSSLLRSPSHYTTDWLDSSSAGSTHDGDRLDWHVLLRRPRQPPARARGGGRRGRAASRRSTAAVTASTSSGLLRTCRSRCTGTSGRPTDLAVRARPLHRLLRGCAAAPDRPRSHLEPWQAIVISLGCWSRLALYDPPAAGRLRPRVLAWHAGWSRPSYGVEQLGQPRAPHTSRSAPCWDDHGRMSSSSSPATGSS